MKESHELRSQCNRNKKDVIQYLKEAKEKGYSILPAHDPKNMFCGYVVFKTIDGIEKAYNPIYPSSEGCIEEYEKGYLAN